MAKPIPAVDPITSAIFSVSFRSLSGSFLCLREKGPKSNEAMLPPRRDDDILVVQRPEDSTQPRGHAFNLLHGASSFSEIRRPKTFLPAQAFLTNPIAVTPNVFLSSRKFQAERPREDRLHRVRESSKFYSLGLPCPWETRSLYRVGREVPT